jgi:hypothetical protein
MASVKQWQAEKLFRLMMINIEEKRYRKFINVLFEEENRINATKVSTRVA